MPRPLPRFNNQVDPLLPPTQALKPFLYRRDEYQTFDILAWSRVAVELHDQEFPSQFPIRSFDDGEILIDRFTPQGYPWCDTYAQKLFNFIKPFTGTDYYGEPGVWTLEPNKYSTFDNYGAYARNKAPVLPPQQFPTYDFSTLTTLTVTVQTPTVITWLYLEQDIGYDGAATLALTKHYQRIPPDIPTLLKIEPTLIAMYSMIISGSDASVVAAALAANGCNALLFSNLDGFLSSITNHINSRFPLLYSLISSVSFEYKLFRHYLEPRIDPKYGYNRPFMSYVLENIINPLTNTPFQTQREYELANPPTNFHEKSLIASQQLQLYDPGRYGALSHRITGVTYTAKPTNYISASLITATNNRWLNGSIQSDLGVKPFFYTSNTQDYETALIKPEKQEHANFPGHTTIQHVEQIAWHLLPYIQFSDDPNDITGPSTAAITVRREDIPPTSSPINFMMQHYGFPFAADYFPGPGTDYRHWWNTCPQDYRQTTSVSIDRIPGYHAGLLKNAVGFFILLYRQVSLTQGTQLPSDSIAGIGSTQKKHYFCSGTIRQDKVGTTIKNTGTIDLTLMASSTYGFSEEDPDSGSNPYAGFPPVAGLYEEPERKGVRYVLSGKLDYKIDKTWTGTEIYEYYGGSDEYEPPGGVIELTGAQAINAIDGVIYNPAFL